MRGFLLASIAFASAIPALTAFSATASSLEYLHAPPASTPSVTAMPCTACPALKPDAREVTYVVPALEPGTDRSELKEINGEMKIVRAEAWLGGSPVTFVSKASDADIKLARGEPAQPALAIHTVAINATAISAVGGSAAAEIGMNVAVDTAMTTASLSPTTAISIASASVAPSPGVSAAPSSPPPAAESSSHDFDGQSLQLRLN